MEQAYQEQAESDAYEQCELERWLEEQYHKWVEDYESYRAQD